MLAISSVWCEVGWSRLFCGLLVTFVVAFANRLLLLLLQIIVAALGSLNNFVVIIAARRCCFSYKMGYELTRFQGDVDEELICPICSGVLEEPVQVSSVLLLLLMMIMLWILCIFISGSIILKKATVLIIDYTIPSKPFEIMIMIETNEVCVKRPFVCIIKKIMCC